MAETKEMKVQRLKAIEKFAAEAEKAKTSLQTAKEVLAQERKQYEKMMDALCRMIKEKAEAPLFGDDEE